MDIKDINLLYKDKAWLDFQVYEYQRYVLIVGGGENLTYSHEIELVFHFPYVVCGMFWEIKTSPNEYDFFKILEDDEAREFNLKHKVIEGNNLYKIIGDDESLIIAAQSFEYRERTVSYWKK